MSTYSSPDEASHESSDESFHELSDEAAVAEEEEPVKKGRPKKRKAVVDPAVQIRFVRSSRDRVFCSGACLLFQVRDFV